MAETLPPEELDRIAGVIKQGSYKDYPQTKQRLYESSKLVLIDDILYVPEGPWNVAYHPNREGVDPDLLDPEVPTSDNPRVASELSRKWLDDGLLLDQYGRPIHPNWEQLLGDKRIGLPTGLGFFYKYGPNATVDAGIDRKQSPAGPEELLLIRRAIGKQWALPGGFKDRGETAEQAARREAAEETGLDAIGGTAEVVFNKLPVGLRDTLNAWTENVVVHIHGDQDYLRTAQPVAAEDAIDVGWFTEEQIDKLDIFDAHRLYISKILQNARRVNTA